MPQKSSIKETVLQVLREKECMTRKELVEEVAKRTGATQRAVYYAIEKLLRENKIYAIGSRKLLVLALANREAIKKAKELYKKLIKQRLSRDIEYVKRYYRRALERLAQGRLAYKRVYYAFSNIYKYYASIKDDETRKLFEEALREEGVSLQIVELFLEYAENRKAIDVSSREAYRRFMIQ